MVLSLLFSIGVVSPLSRMLSPFLFLLPFVSETNFVGSYGSKVGERLSSRFGGYGKVGCEDG